MIRKADEELKAIWLEEFRTLSPEAKGALKRVLKALHKDALQRAQYQWRNNKAPMAYYWKVVGVYAGHIARAIK